MITQGCGLGKLDELLGQVTDVFAQVKQAVRQGQPAHQVEQQVWEQVRALGRQLMTHYFDTQGHGDMGEAVELEDGRVVRRLPQLHRRTYQSVFGPIELDRVVYGSREGQKIELAPLDQRCQLPESDYSYLLQNWAGALSTEQAYARVSETLDRILQLRVPVDSLERMTRQMADSVAGLRESRPAPAPQEEGEVLVASADNKGVPMRRPVQKRSKAGRPDEPLKPNRKQMATVGAAYSVDRHRRTPEEVVAALFEDPPASPDAPRPQRPRPKHKRVWSCLSHQADDGRWIHGQDEVFQWLEREVHARRQPGQPTVCLMDGQLSLWNDCHDHLGCDVIEILDLLHVTSRLWTLAHLFHKPDSPEAERFVRERTRRILHGKVGYVVGGLRQMATKRGLGTSKRRILEKICGYFEKNEGRMRYDQYLAAGYPIASGVIEGACRHVVKDRMERTGMRWTVQGAQAMLDLRSTCINEQWEDLQAYRVAQQTLRLYPHQDVVEHPPSRIAA